MEVGTPVRPPRAGGLAHVGVLYGSDDELAEAVWPHVSSAVVAADLVTAMVDRHVRRRMTTVLGVDAEHVEFERPHDVTAAPPEHLWLRPPVPTGAGRRGLLVNQYAPTPTHGGSLVARESGIDLLLRDLPVTVLCACPRDADRAVTEAFRASHPYLLTGSTTLRNPRYRLPADRSPAPPATWGGRHALRVLFRRVGDLQQVRVRAAALAIDAGLDREVVDVLALAAHEAGVLALGAHEHPVDVGDVGDVGGSCVLDGWVGVGGVVVEVHGPGLDAGRGRRDAGLSGPPTLAAAENLGVVRTFCGPSPVVVTSDARAVRITAAGVPG